MRNVAVITADMNVFSTDVLYDRAVSIECFEHMKNYKKLLKHVSTWLKPDALFFCHVFCHKTLAYHFEDNGDEDWMTRCVHMLHASNGLPQSMHASDMRIGIFELK